MIKNKRGITLIALIITIIVMLILVAVTINMSVNGGLFGYAGNAAAGTKAAQEAEKSLTDIENGMSTEYLMAKYVYGATSGDVARIGSTLYTSIQDAVDAAHYSAILNRSGGNITVSGGTIHCVKAYGIQNLSGATLSVTGGTITADRSYSIYNGGTCTVTGGTLNGDTYGV